MFPPFCANTIQVAQLSSTLADKTPGIGLRRVPVAKAAAQLRMTGRSGPGCDQDTAAGLAIGARDGAATEAADWLCPGPAQSRSTDAKGAPRV